MTQSLTSNPWLRRAIVAVLIGLFWLSLSQDAVLVCAGTPMRGSQIAQVGWMGPIALQFGWYANIGLAWTIPQLLSRRRISGWSAGVAILSLVVALTALGWQNIPSDVAYNSHTVCGFTTGFYLWIACLALGAVATTTLAVADKRDTQLGE